VGPLYNIIGEIPINKLMLIAKDEPKKAASLRWQLGHMLDGEARLMEIMLKDCIEVLPPNTSKGTTLKSHIEKLGIQPENMMAIGDSTNDIEMLQLAGIGVAVGNANDKLKAVADVVVASSDEHGVAEAINRFVLKKDQTPEQPTPTTEPSTLSEDQTED
jgi:Cof subfamily protein (haloacid dehalogenase superfamily)